MGEGGGEVTYAELTTDELESLLPLTFQRKEKRDRPCGSRCPLRKIEDTIVYEQVLYRIDDFMRNPDVRTYEIYYREQNRTSGYRPYQTERHHSFREALIEMCQTLTKAGIISLTEVGK
jgi:hypothetical protein